MIGVRKRRRIRLGMIGVLRRVMKAMIGMLRRRIKRA